MPWVLFFCAAKRAFCASARKLRESYLAGANGISRSNSGANGMARKIAAGLQVARLVIRSAVFTSERPMKRSTVEVRGRDLPVCDHAGCEEHRIWDFATCAEHLSNQERQNLKNRVLTELRAGGNLKGVVLTGADLRGIDFSKADLSGAFLDRCNLSACRFVDTNLRKAYLGWARLDQADLSRAEIHAAVFSGANLNGVTLLAYSLSNGRHPINLSADTFAHSRRFRRPALNEAEPQFTEHAYRALKAYFVEEGDYDGASWASYCERRMQRKCLWRDKRYLAWLASLTFGLSAGYGEQPRRVLLTAAAVVGFYALLYHFIRLEPVRKSPRQDGQPEDDEDGGQLDHCFVV